MFDDFFQTLDELRQQTARFRRVALHLHSIDSHDWGREGDSQLNDPALFAGEEGRKAYAKALSPHFDLIAVTDHMKCGYGCQLSGSCGDILAVLPGMEVNYIPEPSLGLKRIHILAIFQLGTTPSDIGGIFHGLDVPNDDGARDGKTHEVKEIPLKEWNERVREAGGISIAAHVDSTQGVRYSFRHTARQNLSMFSDAPAKELEQENDIPGTFKEYLLSAEFDAIEIHRSSDAKHYRWTCESDGQEKWVPTVLTFDAHRVEQFGQAERVTYLKTTTLDLEGVRTALQFPDTRIRFFGNVPQPPMPRLLGVSVEGGDDSFFGGINVALAENLNCLIGARGSGKSTLVECLRYAFGQNANLEQIPDLAGGIRGLQRANLKDSVIKVAYQTAAGEERVLVTTYDEKSDCSSKVYGRDGELLQIPDVLASNLFPLRLFGWNEVESLGREPKRQRELLDRLIDELDEPLRERENLRAALESNRHEINGVAADLISLFGERNGFIRRFTQYTQDFQQLNTPEMQELFSQLDLANDKRRVLSQADANAEYVLTLLNEEKIGSFVDEISTQLDDGSEELRDWWYGDELEKIGLQKVQEQTLASIREARARIDAYRTHIQSRRDAIDSEIAQLQESIQAQFEGDTDMQRVADLRSNAEKRLRDVASHRRTYQQRYEDLKSAIAARRELATQLKQTQQRIAGIRTKHNDAVQNRLNDFLPEEMKVEIEFVADGDCDALHDPLYEMFTARTLQRKRIRRVMQEESTPVDIAAMLLDRDLSPLVGEGGSDPFTDEDATEALEACQPFDHDPGANVKFLNNDGDTLRAILSLHEVEWDDRESILLNGGPVNKKSPGQRSSAMLPLIALTESTPLVIDQPEDNLDKKLIGNVMINVLAELKEQRQIIVCTHDPNILVGGDAEQVVVLEATSNESGDVVHHGSIDNEHIVQTVVDLLEGGEDAFDARRRRYGF